MAEPKKAAKPARLQHQRIPFILRHEHATEEVIPGDFTGPTHEGVRLTKGASGE